MKSTVKALQSVYLSKGGALTDIYPDIADGAPVGDYVTIPDMISAFVALDRAQGRSGGGVVYVYASGTHGDTDTETFEKATMNANEIVNAIKAGNIVVLCLALHITAANITSNYVLSSSLYSENGGTVANVIFSLDNSTGFSIDTSGNVTSTK